MNHLLRLRVQKTLTSAHRAHLVGWYSRNLWGRLPHRNIKYYPNAPRKALTRGWNRVNWKQLRQPLQNKPGDNADDASGNDAGDDQHREIGEHFETGDEKSRHQDLPQVVEDAATDRNAGH